ncbi:MAG: IS3 family transposase [Gammaproteobacteria bacterium]|nr:IS3 family transposase [Gammaproteobacteria bacterium]
MRNYTESFKKALVKKALLNSSKSAALFAKEAGVANSTLYGWIKRYGDATINNGNNSSKGSDNWTKEERFNMLVKISSLSEEQIGAYCRRQGIYQHQLSEWKDEFMNKKARATDDKRSSELKVMKAENKALKKELRRKDKALAETSALLILKKKSRLALGGLRGRLIGNKERKEALSLIKEACKAGARKIKVCKLLQISIRTYERWSLADGLSDKRALAQHIPANKLTTEERQAIIKIANSAEYCDLPPCKIIPMLADKQIYICSESTLYRILREEKLLNHRGKSKPKTHHKPKQLDATGPNQVWSWDISYLKSHVAGIYFYLYLTMDIYSRKIVGWTVQAHESSEQAAALMKQTCLDEAIDPGQVRLHSDNGSPMKGATLLVTLQQLGIAPSFSRPAVSNDNPYSEAMFKTLKYRPIYPGKGFASIEESRIWVENFVNWYNTEHLHSGLKFVTPEQRHTSADQKILANRKIVYQAAKRCNPSRWSRGVRNWDQPSIVTLNPDKSTIAANSEASICCNT